MSGKNAKCCKKTAFIDRCYNFGSTTFQIMKKILNLSCGSRAVHVLRWDLSWRGGVQVSKMSAKTDSAQDEHLTSHQSYKDREEQRGTKMNSEELEENPNTDLW